MHATIIIVNYNSGNLLRKCIQRLEAQSFQSFNVVIVDNASTDHSMEYCLGLDEKYQTILLNKNIGFAAANNIAGFAASTPWLVTLNPDAVPKEDWLEHLLICAEKHPNTVMFGSTQIDAANPTVIDGAGDVYTPYGNMWRGQYGHSIDTLPPTGFVFSPCAAAAMYRTDLFKLVGGFDERFFCYCEDVDLAFRIRILGYDCIQVKDAVVYHASSAICGKKSQFSIYHGYRNRFWTFVKNMPSPAIYLLMLPHLALTLLLALIELKRGMFRTAMQGIMDGFKGLPDILRSRKSIQKSRNVSNYAILKAMTWSLIKMWRREHDVRRFPS